MEGFDNINPKKVYWEERLWKKAEELSKKREKMSTEATSIFSQVESGNVGAIGLEAKEKKKELQKNILNFWQR